MPGIYSNHINIIRAETVCRRSRDFDAGILNAAKAQGRASNGRALLVVHPRFAEPLLTDPILERTDPYLFQQIMLKDYDAYFDLLGKCIKSVKMLPFVLAGSKSFDTVHGWLSGLGLNKNVFIQSTVKEYDPTPSFGFAGKKYSWRILAETLQEMEINKVFLTGELAYYTRGKETMGCVYITQNELWPYFQDRIKVLRYLTFPGLFGSLPCTRHPVLAGHQDIR